MNDKTIMLVADDDSSYSALVESALRRARIETKAIYVSDGREVIDYLEGMGRFANRNAFPLPHLITLDIKMPRMSGLEALGWIRQHSHFKDLPVMLLTSCTDNSDLRRAKELGANVYIVKPFTRDELAHALREFHDSWLPTLPNEPPARPRARL